MNIKPEETSIEGQWISKNGKVIGDQSCQRIKYLTENVLEKMGVDASGWETLYFDPQDSRYWEHTYPSSHMHGGGPPSLTCISYKKAHEKYLIKR